ncbi:hypothetical protein NL317_31365, partial [Klebsiella pneumoniae]|nr:hypothetical protein [Klebsiella pneumoniae]
VSSDAGQTVVRISVPKPELQNVETRHGVFQRFVQRGGANTAIADSREVGFAELPITGFSALLPVDGDGATLNIQPEGSPT